MPERDAKGLAAALSGPCACARYPAGAPDPGPLVTAGALRALDRVVHSGAHCTEHRLECAACGQRWWVVEDDTGHWQRKGFAWSAHPPLDL